MPARGNLDAPEEQVRPQDWDARLVDEGLPARIGEVVQDEDARPVGLDLDFNGVALVGGDARLRWPAGPPAAS